ncbi:lariat debranching enzyme-like [Helicoverpa zea]|uniref:lariat debranching enzyme-like n=1 Tax=Helicoverpa zea TaxID=7113 RepID=UPI001F56EA80|nr:lariat debranching enzyme-like [Helicoverpa zea]
MKMKIAVEGCAHGELEIIYECIETMQRREGINIDLLICCGDFQSVRNYEDLGTMAVPKKYQNMCSFYKYYSGEKRAPILTLFIGGNHEASNYLQELPYGGWVAPNIYYLGRAGVVKFGDIRIGGMSGIYKPQDYLQGHWECLPYNQSSLRTVYHVRSLEVFRLCQLRDKIHVMLSHDWPRGITDYGDTDTLLRWKAFFREDIESNRLGSVPAMQVLRTLKPDYWFAAHLHCQYAALVKHEDTNTETKFLALDKCLPRRKHLQIVDIPSEYDGELCLRHDVEWLAILKNTNHLLTVKNMNCYMPGPGGHGRFDFSPTDEEKENVVRLLGSLVIKEESFVRTAPIHDPNARKVVPTVPILNPQTVALCEKLGIDDPVQVVMARSGRAMKQPHAETTREEIRPTSSEENVSQVVSQSPSQTPMKSSRLSLLLPAPVTPSNEKSLQATSLETTTVPDTPESTMFYECKTPMFTGPTTVPDTPERTMFYECKTPMSAGPKKTFKRRNMSIYNTPDVDESVSTKSSSSLDDTPQSSKLPYRGDDTNDT